MPYRLNRQPGRAGYQDIKAVGRTVYTTWCYRNGGALEIWFARSFDGGATYETPQCLSREDPLPFLGLGDCEYPTIAVEGLNVYVAWRQHILTAGNQEDHALSSPRTRRAGRSTPGS